MRTASRLAVAALLSSGLLLAAPASAQEVDCDEYPDLAECVIDGEVEAPAQGGSGGGGSDDGGSNNAGGSSGSGSAGGTASLPFTGGEVTLIALAGAAALGGGIALTAAGRKRSTV